MKPINSSFAGISTLSGSHLLYDIFLSHAGEDKPWIRNLASRIAMEEFDGRNLRIWFDEKEIGAGDRFRKHIDAALAKSRFIGVVLTEAGARSKWVSYEWNSFLRLMRGENHVIPLLLRDCEVPVELADLVFVDFRSMTSWDVAFSTLIDRLRSGGRLTLDQVDDKIHDLFRKATDRSQPDFNRRQRPVYDEIHSFFASLDLAVPEYEGLALRAFKAAIDFLGKIESKFAYVPTLVIAECLAVLMHRAPQYHKIAQSYISEWDVYLNGPTAAIRAYSKLAEVKPELVNTTSLLQCADRLDRVLLGTNEKTLLTHLARTVCKLLHTKIGEDLAESLSHRGKASRRAAAFAFDLYGNQGDMPGPIYYLGAMKNLARDALPPRAPSNRAWQTIIRLAKDNDDKTTTKAAENAIAVMSASWPTLETTNSSADDQEEKSASADATYPLTASRGTPFAGRIVLVTSDNQVDLSHHDNTNNIMCFCDTDVVGMLFDTAAAVLLPSWINRLSHAYSNVERLEIPFAVVPEKYFETLRDGLYVEINTEMIHVWSK